MEKEQVYYSISQINEYIKVLFDNTVTLKNIYLKGEISNYKGRNKSGHIYFTLKDEKCSINAVLFKYDTFSLNFEPKTVMRCSFAAQLVLILQVVLIK